MYQTTQLKMTEDGLSQRMTPKKHKAKIFREKWLTLPSRTEERTTMVRECWDGAGAHGIRSDDVIGHSAYALFSLIVFFPICVYWETKALFGQGNRG